MTRSDEGGEEAGEVPPSRALVVPAPAPAPALAATRALALPDAPAHAPYVIELPERDDVASQAVLSLGRRHLGMRGSVHFSPSIPPAKEDGARRAHAVHLPADEPLLVLYDDTLFGGAKDGFLVTPAHLNWKNFLDHPRRIAWSDLDPSTIRAEVGKVHVAGGVVNMAADLADGARVFFTEMAYRSRPSTGPYRGAALARAEARWPIAGADLALDAVLATARAHVGEVQDVYYHLSIPSAKEARARATHAAHLPEDEPIVVLYDDTVFGSAEEGFVLTPRRICWKNLGEAPKSGLYGALVPERVSGRDNAVWVDGAAIQLTARSELVAPVAALVRALIAMARHDG